MYPRVLECILQTESPELMLNHKDEILETLGTIANDQGKQTKLEHFCFKNAETSCFVIKVSVLKKAHLKCFVHVNGKKILGIKNNK